MCAGYAVGGIGGLAQGALLLDGCATHSQPAPAPARSVLLCVRVRVVLLAWQHCAKACVYCTHCVVTNVVAHIIHRTQSVYANLSINMAMWCGLVAGVVRKIFTCAGLGSSAFFCVLLGMGYVTSSQGAVVCTFGACCCSNYSRLFITRVHYCWRIIVILTETGSGSACGRAVSSNISVLSVLAEHNTLYIQGQMRSSGSRAAAVTR